MAGYSDGVGELIVFCPECAKRELGEGSVNQLTEIVAAAPGDPSYTKRTWVLITESPEGV